MSVQSDFSKRTCARDCGEKDRTLVFALRCVNGRVTVQECDSDGRHCESLFFFFFLPLLLFLVTIARDRSRGVRNKIIWHIFFQLLDTLPVCQDFNRQVCNRPACKFIHLSDGEFS